MLTTVNKAWRMLRDKGPGVFFGQVRARVARVFANVKPPASVIDDPQRDDVAGAHPTIVVSAVDPAALTTELLGSPKIAVQLHVYFADLADELLEAVNHIPYPYDCYISVDTEEKRNEIQRLFAGESDRPACTAHRVSVEVLPNRGRDIAPFLTQLAPVIADYEFIGHAHTKRSVHIDWGDDWRRDLLANTFGSPDAVDPTGYLNTVFSHLTQHQNVGLVLPDAYTRIRPHLLWDTAETRVRHLLDRLELPRSIRLPGVPLFPAGDFFWARTAAVRPLFDLGLTPTDFEPEEGQIRLTLAHVIERSWVYVAQGTGYDYAVFRDETPRYQHKD